MATRLERLLAAFDKVFYAYPDRCTPGHDGAAYEEMYWSGLGRKFCIVDKVGNVSTLGNSFWIRHRYDMAGKLLSRKRILESAGPDDRIVYGHDLVYETYRDQPSLRNAGPAVGMTIYC